MKNFLFSSVFVISLVLVYTGPAGVFSRNFIDLRYLDYDVLYSDTLKVFKDSSFIMNMATNNPFNGAKSFTLNLAEISDTSYSYPLIDSKVISKYGPRNGRSHDGVDLKTRPNDSIRCAFEGVVIMSDFYYGYGNCIIVRHYNGLETLYSHNSRNLVTKGEHVCAGQSIALTGRTGRATTEHLHFECRIKGLHFDPGVIFDYSSQKLRYGYLRFEDNGTFVNVEFKEVSERL